MTLGYNKIGNVVEDTLQYLDDRRTGKIQSLKTTSKKLNRATLEGFEWGRIVTLAGLSGSGKSLILEQWKRDFVTENPNENIEILSFEFEMLAQDQIIRQLSRKTGYSIRELQTTKFSNTEFKRLRDLAEDLKTSPISYVDEHGTIPQIVETIMEFIKDKKIREENKGLIITLDHILLTQRRQSDAERALIANLYSTLIAMKKNFAKNGIRCLMIMLSQLNGKLKDSARITNPNMHYPIDTDLFGSASIFHGSDYVIISHIPAKMNGIGEYYGMPIGDDYPKGLPLYHPKKPDKMMMYWHVLKNRAGKTSLLMMEEDFAQSRILDYIKDA